ncbi:acyl-coenzyme A synthetase/AMP-(fatty) acid ligase [Bradyrhizobium diazoefficiens]
MAGTLIAKTRFALSPGHDAKTVETRAMLTEAKTYDELYRNFRWDIPARFNMAEACCDRHADGTGRLALIYVDENGVTTRTSFDEVAEMSRRFANVLKADGLARGDRVAVFLSQSLELPIAHMAAFRSGLISIPLFALFGEDALEFRLSNSQARAIITDEAGWEKLTRVRDRLPYLQDIYITSGAVHAGAKPFWPAIETASEDFATVDTSADDPALIIYTSGTTGNPKGALHAHRVVLGHLPNVEMCHNFLPRPGDLMWTPADWAWIGGLVNGLLAFWYHGIPLVGHRARKFEPQAAMQMMADLSVRNVFLPPTALKLMRQAGVKHPGVKLCSIFTGGESLARRTLGLGARDLRHRRARSIRPDRVQSRDRQQLQPVSDPARRDGQGDAGLRRPHRQRQGRGAAARAARHHRRAPAVPRHHARILAQSGGDA